MVCSGSSPPGRRGTMTTHEFRAPGLFGHPPDHQLGGCESVDMEVIEILQGTGLRASAFTPNNAGSTAVRAGPVWGSEFRWTVFDRWGPPSSSQVSRGGGGMAVPTMRG